MSNGRERLDLARNAGFDFVELSCDESPERQARMDWNEALNAKRLQRCRRPDSGISLHDHVPERPPARWRSAAIIPKSRGAKV